MTEPSHSDNPNTENLKRSLLVTLSAGCLTLIVAGLAIGAGVLLDLRHDTLPRWTLIFLVGSAPLTLGGVYLLVRRALKKPKDAAESGEGDGGGDGGGLKSSSPND